MTFGAELQRFGQVSPGLDTYPVRFSKPITVTVATAALIAVPLTGAALADAAKPQPAASAPQHAATPAPHASASKPDDKRDDRRDDKDAKAVSLSVSVNPGRVRAGDSYGVTIILKGGRSGTATVTSPEGKSYRVALSGGRATKTLSVPSNARSGSKTVSVKAGGKTATASFTVVGGAKQPQPKPTQSKHDDKRDDSKRDDKRDDNK